jgi:enoyl-CoA hydratase/carnithine racemase
VLDEPECGNRLSRGRMEKLRQELESLARLDELRVLIVCGMGGFFSVGADLREIGALNEDDAPGFSREGQEILSLFSRVAPVTIAAIDGFCLGGGLDLALNCTFRYASPGSSFQHPGTRRGIITGWGGTQRLPRLVGQDAALRLLILGESIGAAEAMRIGLVTDVVDDPPGHAANLAQRIADGHTRTELTALMREMN